MGSNIRPAGSQLKKNEIALRKGHLLNPASIGFLASLGIDNIKVYTKPVISLIVTGDELVEPGKTLNPGKIYESNAPVLKSALEKEGVSKINILKSKDNFESVKKVFIKALATSDFVIFTGGISVGDYDFVGEVLKSEKVTKKFHGVKQKPGKPLYFGVKKDKFIFGLPGNPASVLMCFYEYVLPAIRKFQNRSDVNLPVLNLPLNNSANKKNSLTVFLKATADLKSVTVLEGQESYIMKSFAEANCFVVLNENDNNLAPGSLVEVHLFFS